MQVIAEVIERHQALKRARVIEKDDQMLDFFAL
jgi:hypothetical protein